MPFACNTHALILNGFLMQGRDLSDSVLGVGTPGRVGNRGGVYFYANLSSTEPQDTSNDAQLGLTRVATVPAGVVNKSPNTLYGE